jgi:hypothetical protein
VVRKDKKWLEGARRGLRSWQEGARRGQEEQRDIRGPRRGKEGLRRATRARAVVNNCFLECI